MKKLFYLKILFYVCPTINSKNKIMSNLKHTPGPWHVYLGAVVNERNMIVVPDGISEADAKLIAAAPELLRVLKQVRCAMDASDNIDANGTITQQFGEFFVKEISKAIDLATS